MSGHCLNNDYVIYNNVQYLTIPIDGGTRQIVKSASNSKNMINKTCLNLLINLLDVLAAMEDIWFIFKHDMENTVANAIIAQRTKELGG